MTHLVSHALVGLLLAGTASAHDATATGAPPAAADRAVHPARPFAPGEQIDLALEYLSVPTGRAQLIVGRPEGAIWPIICQARTEGAATMIDVREHYVSYWDEEANASRGSDLNAIEMSDRHTDHARFDRLNGKASVQVIRKGKVTERVYDVPRDVRDLASALLDLRMQDLTPGARFELPVFHGSSSFVMKGEVEGRERIDTPAGSFDTYRLKAQLGFQGKFNAHEAYLWLSADARRIPVRMSAHFALGEVTATLTAYRPGGQYAAAR